MVSAMSLPSPQLGAIRVPMPRAQASRVHPHTHTHGAERGPRACARGEGVHPCKVLARLTEHTGARPDTAGGLHAISRTTALPQLAGPPARPPANALPINPT